MSSVERDERVERLARNIEDAFNSALESGNTTREALAFALDQALPWGAVPSPDGPDDAEPTEAMRRFLSLCFNHAGRHVVTADALREVERLARRGGPDGGDLPARGSVTDMCPECGGLTTHWGKCSRWKPVGALPSPREDTVTRVELIDHRTGAEPFGRVFSAWNCRVEVQRQDGGRTLKVFVDGEAPQPPETLSDVERAEELARIRNQRLGASRSGGGSALEGTGQ